MNYVTRILNETYIKAMLVILAIAMLTIAGISITNNAEARTQYTPNGMGTTSTPVFNEFYDVPNGVGDEADFVRIKPQAGTNADYVNTLSDACKAGAAFTVRTYVHNGADPTFNEGTATAIARNTVVGMNVKTFNQVQKNFEFTSSISASNASSMTDKAELKCADNVILKLIPSSVQTYSKTLGFQGAPDSSVNGTLKIGSRTQGSGDVYACWDDRVIIVYEVVVEEKPVVKIPAVCDLIAATLSAKNVTVSDVKYTANDAVVNNISLDFGDGNKKVIPANKVGLPYTHTYQKAGNYTVRATLNTTFEGNTQYITSNSCAKNVVVKDVPTPTYSCEDYKLTVNDRTVTTSFKPVATNGAVFRDATVKYISDGEVKNEVTTNKVESNGTVVTSYTFDENATSIQSTAQVRFNVNSGKDMYTEKVDCSGQAVLGTNTPPPVTPPEVPESPVSTLPDTGAGSTIAIIFAAVTAVGAYAHRALTLKRQ
jgi:hypothetical protein